MTIVTVLAVLVALSLGAPKPCTIVTPHTLAQHPGRILPRLGPDTQDTLVTAQHSMYSNDKHDSATERAASTVDNFQSTTMQEQRSFGDLLNLARIKYLGRDLRLRHHNS